MTRRARTLVADPPWKFGDRLPGPGRGAAKHYPVMTVDEIAGMKLPPLADDCRLFLWRVASMQDEALHVVTAWGFKLKAEMVWVKTRHGHPDRLDWPMRETSLAFGMGRQVRNAHEACLIATRGKPERLSASVRSVFFAPLGEHSAKPDLFYELVEELSPAPRVELFARRRRQGWTTLGNEIDGRDFLAV